VTDDDDDDDDDEWNVFRLPGSSQIFVLCSVSYQLRSSRINQDKQCICKAKLRRVRVTAVGVEKHYVLNNMDVSVFLP
jgi:hypothetical protein